MSGAPTRTGGGAGRLGLLAAAWETERRKALASPVVVTTAALVAGGITVLAASLTLAARAGNEQIRAQLGATLGQSGADGWTTYTGALAQVSGAAALLGFGVALSWFVGREFADGTLAGLFALPVSRQTTALAKLLVYAAWAAVVAAASTVSALVAGLAIGLGPPDGGAVAALGRLCVLVLLTAVIATPAAWTATLGRGLLSGIAATVLVIATAQVLAVAGTGARWPFAAPALWALDPTSVTAPQLGLPVLVGVGFGALTIRSWAHLELDR
ncbi:ABC-2 type transport system permease protein [Mumia flava]|uniref:ABC-2 type transport system permease protein n=1 Tax=Mumia flava TaxID=1348852 RepID=A0A2M9BGZ9_9ACTN|nr:ABC transporter permease [Mumia flava]PJJ57184.1 ABC-2 type transport system permease protein [Mumia flava]